MPLLGLLASPFRRTRGEIRLLCREEFPALLAHISRLGPEERRIRFHHDMDAGDLSRWSRTACLNDVLVWVCDGKIRGHVEIGYRGTHAECALAVESGWPGRRIARTLFASACTRARASGATILTIAASRGNRLDHLGAGTGARRTHSCGRSIILPVPEPALPLWLVVDLAELREPATDRLPPCAGSAPPEGTETASRPSGARLPTAAVAPFPFDTARRAD